MYACMVCCVLLAQCSVLMTGLAGTMTSVYYKYAIAAIIGMYKIPYSNEHTRAVTPHNTRPHTTHAHAPYTTTHTLHILFLQFLIWLDLQPSMPYLRLVIRCYCYCCCCCCRCCSSNNSSVLLSKLVFFFQWRDDVNSKVMLANNQPIPTLLLANKVSALSLSLTLFVPLHPLLFESHHIAHCNSTLNITTYINITSHHITSLCCTICCRSRFVFLFLCYALYSSVIWLV